MPIDIRIIEAGTTKSEEAHSMGNLEEHNTEKGHILFLIFLAIGMILQLTGNNYCILTGTVVCVSTCGFICSWIFFSAVRLHNEPNSFSRTPDVSE